jgi:hypothetical protein
LDASFNKSAPLEAASTRLNEATLLSFGSRAAWQAHKTALPMRAAPNTEVGTGTGFASAIEGRLAWRGNAKLLRVGKAGAAVESVTPNPSFERTATSSLRELASAAQLER